MTPGRVDDASRSGGPAGRSILSRRLRVWALGLLPLLVLILVVAGIAIHNRAGRSTPAGTDVAQNRPGTVLLVAGYGGSTASLSELSRALTAAGRTVRIVPPVGDNTGPLRDQAEALDRTARAAIAAGAPSVDVVGYSAGGVVTRIWAAELGGADLARRVVTLGSPQHGTDVAGLAAGLLPGACPTACQQLAPSSAVLAGLPETPAGPGWTSVYTAYDDLVTPPNSAALRGAVNIELQSVCADDRVKHSALPKDPLAVGLVLLALDGPARSAPPSADSCSSLRRTGSGN